MYPPNKFDTLILLSFGCAFYIVQTNYIYLVFVTETKYNYIKRFIMI